MTNLNIAEGIALTMPSDNAPRLHGATSGDLMPECVYLHAFSGGGEARRGIEAWMNFYNSRRPHTAHGGVTPGSVYQDALSASGPGSRPDLQPTAQAA